MTQTVQDILKKIQYIEADMEVQKHILMSVPSDRKKEIEQVLGKIAGQKQQIKTLREEIREIDAGEYERILQFEKASETFRTIAQERSLTSVVTMNEDPDCAIVLAGDGRRIPCLVKAREKSGRWLAITLEAEILELSAEEVTG